jgi:hypothetical protein
VLLAVWTLVEVLRPEPLRLPQPVADIQSRSTTPLAPNPLALPGALGDLLIVIRPWLNAATSVPVIVLVAVSLVARYRGSTEIARLQLKWPALASSIAFLLLIIAIVLPKRGPSEVVSPSDLAWIGAVFAGALVPVAAGASILRYRLYDIDVLIKRTAVYGATSAAIAAAFFLGIVGLQPLLRPLTSGTELAVAASTLISIALFSPIHRRVQAAVDRRFDRSRFEAARMLDAFADELRDEVDLDALRVHLMHAVGRTMRPAHASLWLRKQLT